MSFKKTANKILEENISDTIKIGEKQYSYKELKKEVVRSLEHLAHSSELGDHDDVQLDIFDSLKEKWAALAKQDRGDKDWDRYLTHDRFDPHDDPGY